MMNAPLYRRVSEFAAQEKVPFYMPGHKGRPTPNGFGSPLAPWDVTELPETDSLTCPEEVIAEAQDLAARAFGASHSFFLVNGASIGILAMLYYALEDGYGVIVDRACHASVINGLVLTGACPVFLSPEPFPGLDVPGGISAEALERAFAVSPEAKAVVLTYPTYYGFCNDLKSLCAIAHRHGALVLVDEAHGAHLPFGDALPPAALSCGADIVVQSMHKMLPAPNQSALLHCRSGVNASRLKACINLFQTTSPSYPIMAYMDAARALAEAHGAAWTEQLHRRLAPIRRYEAVSPLPLSGVVARDPFKLILQGRGLHRLFSENDLYPELCEGDNCLLLCSWNTTDSDVSSLLRVLARADLTAPSSSPALAMADPLSIPAMRPREAFHGTSRLIPLRESVGRISQYSITAFPPCIPILLPGEEITIQKAERLLAMQKKGAAINGLRNHLIAVLNC